ncbi:MAG: ATP-binding protein, partial [Gammaproteobacteria bacterium]|nr:ATP-binding protein [Gammaproteobacteria bacterium]
ATFAPLPATLADPRVQKSAAEQFRTWLRNDCPLVLRRSAALKLVSAPGETEGAFRARLQQRARELRDQDVTALRQKYAAKVATLEDRLRRARQAEAREREQAASSKVDALASVGTAVLGALFGRKVVSSSNAGRAASVLRKAGNVQRQAGDVTRATETVAELEARLAALNAEVQAGIDALSSGYDAQAEVLEEINVRPKAADIAVQFCGIGWVPAPPAS